MEAGANVRFGSEADMCAAKPYVRFTPNNDRESGLPHTVMSALPLKADVCDANRHVHYGPIADMGAPQRSRSIDDFVGHLLQHQGHRDPERLRGFHVDQKLELSRLLDRQVSRLGTLQDLVHIARASPA